MPGVWALVALGCVGADSSPGLPMHRRVTSYYQAAGSGQSTRWPGPGDDAVPPLEPIRRAWRAHEDQPSATVSPRVAAAGPASGSWSQLPRQPLTPSHESRQPPSPREFDRGTGLDEQRITTVFTLPDYDVATEGRGSPASSAYPPEPRYADRRRTAPAAPGEQGFDESFDDDNWPTTSRTRHTASLGNTRPRIGGTSDQDPSDDAAADHRLERRDTRRLEPADEPAPRGTRRTDTTAADAGPPLAAAMLALFASLGGNLYLGWTHANLRWRYQEMLDRLRLRSTRHDGDSDHALRRETRFVTRRRVERHEVGTS